MNIKFASKHMNEVMIAMIVVTGFAVVTSSIMMMMSLKKLSVAYGEASAVPVDVPLLSKQLQPYSIDEYKAIKQIVDINDDVKIDVKPDMLIISSSDIKNEPQWRHAVSDAMAVDRNLHSKRVCGSATKACSGGALVAELVGVHQIFFVKNN